MTSIIDAVWSLRTAMRRLWADHAIWTLQYIVAAVAGTPDAEHAAARLLKNQVRPPYPLPFQSGTVTESAACAARAP